MMDIFLFIIFFVIGVVLGGMGISQVLLCLFCAIPNIKKLNRIGAINSSGAYKQTFGTIIIWSIISIIIIIPILLFTARLTKIGFFIGLGITTLMAITKCVNNKANVRDFLKSYNRFLYLHNANLPDILDALMH